MTVALDAARASLGHIGRARRLATDPDTARRRAEVLSVPLRVTGLAEAFAAAAALVKAAKAEGTATKEALDEPEREALRRAFGEGSTGKGVAAAIRGSAGAMKDLEARQKSRATRIERDALDLALLDLAAFYRDVLAIQFGADVELANASREPDLRADRRVLDAEGDGTADRGHHALPGAAGCQRCAPARRRGADSGPGRAALSPRLTPSRSANRASCRARRPAAPGSGARRPAAPAAPPRPAAPRRPAACPRPAARPALAYSMITETSQ